MAGSTGNHSGSDTGWRPRPGAAVADATAFTEIELVPTEQQLRSPAASQRSKLIPFPGGVDQTSAETEIGQFPGGTDRTSADTEIVIACVGESFQPLGAYDLRGSHGRSTPTGPPLGHPRTLAPAALEPAKRPPVVAPPPSTASGPPTAAADLRALFEGRATLLLLVILVAVLVGISVGVLLTLKLYL